MLGWLHKNMEGWVAKIPEWVDVCKWGDGENEFSLIGYLL